MPGRRSPTATVARGRTPLSRQQILGFWSAWAGWMLDGMDSVIYALVLVPALTELLPRSGYTAGPTDIGYAGSILFALFLVGWGLSFLWGPIADRFGRSKTLAATVLIYSVFTGASAFADSVWQLGLFRFLAGIGIGGEWAVAGTYVAEAWPEDRRAWGAGLLHTGYYFGFFVAAGLNLTVGASLGWRAMFLCGFVPVLVSLLVLSRVKEPERWRRHAPTARRAAKLEAIFSGIYLRRTLVNSVLLTIAIIGLWAAAVYEPAAIATLARATGHTGPAVPQLVSFGTAVLSVGTILGCVGAPLLAERYGRRIALGIYFAVTMAAIPLAFGWAFYLPADVALPRFIAVLFLMGLGGASFSIFTIWLPEQYGTELRATAFAFCTSIGRFIGAGVNFALAAAVAGMGTLGTPIALTGVAFAIGLLLLPLATETRGQPLPE